MQKGVNGSHKHSKFVVFMTAVHSFLHCTFRISWKLGYPATISSRMSTVLPHS